MAQDKSKLTELEREILAEIEKGNHKKFHETAPELMPGLNGWTIPGFRIPWVEVLIIGIGIFIIWTGIKYLVSPHLPEPCSTYTYTIPTGETTRYCIGEGPNPSFGK